MLPLSRPGKVIDKKSQNSIKDELISIMKSNGKVLTIYFMDK